jgi:superfamily II DNA or RNA helicase
MVRISSLPEITTYFEQFEDNETKGKLFEKICKELLVYINYPKKIISVDYWKNDIDLQQKLHLTEKDTGVDLIITFEDGKKGFVQAKFRSNSSLTLSELSTFLAFLSNSYIDQIFEFGLIISNTNLSKSVLTKSLDNFNKKILTYCYSDFDQLIQKFPINISEKNEIKISKNYLKLTLKPYQEDVISRTAEYFFDEIEFDEDILDYPNNRASIFLPTGSGKTVISYILSALFEDGIKIIVSPLIQLLDQTARNYNRYQIKNFENITPPNKQLKIVSDGEIENEEQLTTNSFKIKKFLSELEDKENCWIFVTYQSLFLLYQCLSETQKTSELIIFDEAHHTVGNIQCREILNSDIFKNFLFFTATPKFLRKVEDIETYNVNDEENSNKSLIKYYDNKFCMKNTLFYGDCVYEMSIRQAINQNIINHYQIYFPVNCNNIIESQFIKIDKSLIEPNLLISLAMLTQAFERKHITQTFVFFNSIKSCENFHKIIEMYPEIFKFKSETIHSNKSMKRRREILDKFENREINFICSVDSLNEGVDSKIVDSVLFAEKITSSLNIVQKIGRSLRLDQGKKPTKIMIPLDDKQIIKGNSMFDGLLNIIKSLSKSDEVLKHYFTMKYQARLLGTNYSNENFDNIIFMDWCEFNSEELMKYFDNIDLEVCKNVFHSDCNWFDKFSKLKNFYKKYERYPSNSKNKIVDEDEEILKNFLFVNRRLYQEKKLNIDREILMKSINKNILENQIELRWGKNKERLRNFVKTYNRIPQNSTDIIEEKKLYPIVSCVKRLYFNNMLSQKRYEELIEIHPKMFVNTTEETWMLNYENLFSFVATYKKYPRSRKINNFENKLANWREVQKAKNKIGKLTEEKQNLLKIIDINFFELDRDVYFEKRLKEFDTFFRLNKRLPIETKKDKKEYSLCNWLKRQIRSFNINNLEDWKACKLLDINKDIFKQYNKNEQIWNINFEKFKEFYLEYSCTPSSCDENIEIKSLGLWFLKNRKEFFKNNLSSEKITLFLQLDEDIFVDRYESQWFIDYEEEKEYFKKNKTLRISTDSGFMSNNRKKYKIGKLSIEKIKLLDEITDSWRLATGSFVSFKFFDFKKIPEDYKEKFVNEYNDFKLNNYMIRYLNTSFSSIGWFGDNYTHEDYIDMIITYFENVEENKEYKDLIYEQIEIYKNWKEKAENYIINFDIEKSYLNIEFINSLWDKLINNISDKYKDLFVIKEVKKVVIERRDQKTEEMFFRNEDFLLSNEEILKIKNGRFKAYNKENLVKICMKFKIKKYKQMTNDQKINAIKKFFEDQQ